MRKLERSRFLEGIDSRLSECVIGSVQVRLEQLVLELTYKRIFRNKFLYKVKLGSHT